MSWTDTERSRDQYEEILDIFTTPGWKHILEDIKGSYDKINCIDTCATEQEFYTRKGELMQINFLSKLEYLYKLEFESKYASL